jgi:hypothetical protein
VALLFLAVQETTTPQELEILNIHVTYTSVFLCYMCLCGDDLDLFPHSYGVGGCFIMK